MRANKTGMLFLKRLIKYFLILAVLLLMIAPLYVKSYDLAKQLTVEKSAAKLQDGLNALERQIMRAQEISGLLRQEESFKRLLFLRGDPPSSYYPEFNRLQSKLKSLSLTQEFFSNAYLVFRDNPVFVSGAISSDDYASVYAREYGYPGMSFERWREELFGESYIVKLLPAKPIRSAYAGRGEFEGLSLLINASYYNALGQKSVLVVDIDSRALVERFLYENQIGDHLLYVTDSENRPLLTHNADASLLFSEPDGKMLEETRIGSRRYVMLESTGGQLGLKAIAGVPSSTFEDGVNALLELVVAYAALGMLAVVALAVAFSVRETLSLKGLVEAAGKLSQTRFTARDEYAYIDLAFTRIHSLNEERLGRIEALSESVRYSTLKNLLLLGVHTEREIEEATASFGDRFDRFCVIRIRYRPEASPPDRTEETERLRLIGTELEPRFREALRSDALELNMQAGETVFVVFGGGGESERIPALKERLAEAIRSIQREPGTPPIVNIGMSGEAHGLRQAKTAYGQAGFALSLNDNGVSSGVSQFEAAATAGDGPEFDGTVTLKLHDALIAGDRTAVEQIFADSLKQLASRAQAEQEQLQIFFTIRQTVFDARKTIGGSGARNEASSLPELPEYDRTQDAARLFVELERTALSLCESVAGRKKSNNERLKTDILDYIASHYADPALSAGSLASSLLISEKYVFSFVKEQTGKSLGKYIEEIRLLHAERLLLETDESNSAILKQCGFGSENTFYRAFSKKHGVTPAVWKENRRRPTP